MSENYIVLVEQPFLIGILKLATSQAKGRSLAQCLDWHPQEKVLSIQRTSFSALNIILITEYISKLFNLWYVEK